MRQEKAGRLLDLARRLAASAEGLTLDEMAAATGAGRRTAERLRDALAMLFPQMEELTEGLIKRYRIPGGLDGVFQTPTAEELPELNKAATSLRAGGAERRALTLERLEHKVRSAMRSQALRRMVPDLEALVRAETIAVQAGPRPFEDETVIATIRMALMAMKAIRFRYLGGSRPGALRTATPFGLMFGRANYLVAAELGSPDSNEPRNWRLDRIKELVVLDQASSAPEAFSLNDYASRSFGIYQDEARDVVLRVTPAGAEDALVWRFHPTQTVEAQPDGSVRVQFRASGMLELAWHLFTWGDKVEVVDPPELRETLLEQLRQASRWHERASSVSAG